MKRIYERTPLTCCGNCPYRESKLQEEETAESFGPRSAIAVPISLEMACKESICLLDSRGEFNSPLAQIFINTIQLNNSKEKGK